MGGGSIEEKFPHPAIVSEAINKKTKLRLYVREWKRRQRRKVLDGYPMPPMAMSLDEIRAYLHAPEIVCLLCGKPFRQLAWHLAAIHKMAPDDYRERYGLNYRSGLWCADLKDRMSALMSTPEQAAHLARVRVPFEDRAKPKHRSSAAHRMTAAANGLKAPRTPRTVLREHVVAVIEAMEATGSSLAKALRGRCSNTAFRGELARNPDLLPRFNQAVEIARASARAAVSAKANRVACDSCGAMFKMSPRGVKRTKTRRCPSCRA